MSYIILSCNSIFYIFVWEYRMTYTTYDDFIKDVPCVMKAIDNANACKLMRCNTTANTKSVIYFEWVSFSYTWCDQQFPIPATATYCFVVCWAWAYRWTWWCSSWRKWLTYWDTLSVMVWQSWQATQNGTYWFWWTWRLWGRSWWWLTWFFTWSSEILSSDSARALIIWWGAWWGWWDWDAWWSWWWTNWWQWWTSDYWTVWSWWTQTWRWWSWNKASCDTPFLWWNWSWSYWSWWGWGWRGWNWAQWDWSSDDDKWAWWWSWYIWWVRCWETCNWKWAWWGNNGSAFIKIIWVYDTLLLSYEEIVAMATYNNIITELNSAPLDYYNQFNTSWHIIPYPESWPDAYWLSNNGSRTEINGYNYFYSSTDNIWTGSSGPI